jgi:hypothetical protein
MGYATQIMTTALTEYKEFVSKQDKKLTFEHFCSMPCSCFFPARGASYGNHFEIPSYIVNRSAILTRTRRNLGESVSFFDGLSLLELSILRCCIESIYPLVEPLSPMALTRRASGGVIWFSAVGLTGCGVFRLRSIGDNRSTI